MRRSIVLHQAFTRFARAVTGLLLLTVCTTLSATQNTKAAHETFTANTATEYTKPARSADPAAIFAPKSARSADSVAALQTKPAPSADPVAALQTKPAPSADPVAVLQTKPARLADPAATFAPNAKPSSAPQLGGDTVAFSAQTKKLLQENVFPVAVKHITDTKIVYEDGATFAPLHQNEFMQIGTAFLRNDGFFYSCADVFNLITQSTYSDYYVLIDGEAYKVGAVHKFSLSRNFIVFSLVNYPPDATSASKQKQKNEQSIQEKILSIKNGLFFDANSLIIDSIKEKLNAKAKSADSDSCYALYANGSNGLHSQKCAITKTDREKINSEWQWGVLDAINLTTNKKARGSPVVTQNGSVIGMVTEHGYMLFIDECENIGENTGDICYPFEYKLPNIEHKTFNRIYMDEIALPLTLNALRTRVQRDFSRYLETFSLSVRKQFGVTGELGFLQSTGSKDIIASGFVSDFPLTLSTQSDGTWAYFAPEKIEKDLLEDKGVTLFGSLFDYSLALITKPETVTLEKLASSPRIYMDYLLYAFPLSRKTKDGKEIFVRSLGMPYKSERYTDAQKRIWYVNYWHVHYCNQEIITYALPLPEGLYVMMKRIPEGTTEEQTRLAMRFMADCVYARYSASIKLWKEYYAFLRRTNALYPPFNSLLFDCTPKLFKLKSTWFDLELTPNDFSYTDESTMRLAMGYSYANGRLVSEVRSIELYTDYKASDYRYLFFAKSPRPLEGASSEALAEWSEKQNGMFPFCAEPYNHETFTYYDEVFYPTTKAMRKEAKTLYLFSCELRGANRFDAIKDFAFNMKSCFRLIE